MPKVGYGPSLLETVEADEQNAATNLVADDSPERSLAK